MPESGHCSFLRYLEAKKVIDDKALNQGVWRHMAELLRDLQQNESVAVLEVGCAIGTMVERMLERGLLTRAAYTAIDLGPELVAEAEVRLRGYAEKQGFQTSAEAKGALTLQRYDCHIFLKFRTVDLFEIGASGLPDRTYDLIVAHAFLDLVDLDSALQRILSLTRPGGLLYFTLNFDGATVFEPQIEPALDQQIEELYHQSMDVRHVGSRPSRMSRTGRRLLASLVRAGLPILSAGSSDWVIHPCPAGYSPDEAYFLHFIVDTVRGALTGKPGLDQRLFGGWIAERHRQIEKNELVYVAHQIDVLAQVPAT